MNMSSKRQALSDKIIIVGIDGMDPALDEKTGRGGQNASDEDFARAGSRSGRSGHAGRSADDHTADVDDSGDGGLSSDARHHLLLAAVQGTDGSGRVQFLFGLLPGRTAMERFCRSGKKTVGLHWPVPLAAQLR